MTAAGKLAKIAVMKSQLILAFLAVAIAGAATTAFLQRPSAPE
jgi:hypothetical protein